MSVKRLEWIAGGTLFAALFFSLGGFTGSLTKQCPEKEPLEARDRGWVEPGVVHGHDIQSAPRPTPTPFVYPNCVAPSGRPGWYEWSPCDPDTPEKGYPWGRCAIDNTPLVQVAILHNIAEESNVWMVRCPKCGIVYGREARFPPKAKP